MVQIFQAPQQQSIGEMIGSAIGQGFGNSFNKGMDLNISQRLNEMLEEKQAVRQAAQRKIEGAALARALGKPELADLFGGLGPDLSKFMVQNIGAENLSDEMMKIMGIASDRPPESMQQPQQRQQAPMNQPSPQQAQGMPQQQPFRGAPYKMPVQAQMSQEMQPNQAQQQLAPISEETPGAEPQPVPARKPMSDRDISDMIRKVPPKDRPALLRTLQEQKKFDLAQQKFENQKDIAERNLELARDKAEKTFSLAREKLEHQKAVAEASTEQKNIESEEKAAAPFMEEIRTAEKTLSDISAAIDTAEDAIRSGDLSGFGKDYWSQKLNIPQLTTAKGKQLTAALKNFMTQGKDIFGSRVSNYDVQLLEGMFPRVGESKWAGLSALEMQKFRRDVSAKKIEETNNVREELGKIPRDIDLRVNKSLKPYLEDRRKDLRAKMEFYAAMDGQKVDYRYMKKSLEPDEVLILKNGKPVGSAKKSDIEQLKKQGYEIVK